MSVLVKGMRMPKSCGECFFYDNGGCFVTMYIVLLKRDEDKPKWCPLVEVSEDAVSPCEVCPLVKVDETAILDGWDKVYPDDDDECVVGCDGICEECPMGKEKNK